MFMERCGDLQSMIYWQPIGNCQMKMTSLLLVYYQAGSGDGRSKTRGTIQVTGQVRAIGRIIIILLPFKWQEI